MVLKGKNSLKKYLIKIGLASYVEMNCIEKILV